MTSYASLASFKDEHVDYSMSLEEFSPNNSYLLNHLCSVIVFVVAAYLQLQKERFATHYEFDQEHPFP